MIVFSDSLSRIEDLEKALQAAVDHLVRMPYTLETLRVLRDAQRVLESELPPSLPLGSVLVTPGGLPLISASLHHSTIRLRVPQTDPGFVHSQMVEVHRVLVQGVDMPPLALVDPQSPNYKLMP